MSNRVEHQISVRHDPGTLVGSMRSGTIFTREGILHIRTVNPYYLDAIWAVRLYDGELRTFSNTATGDVLPHRREITIIVGDQ